MSTTTLKPDDDKKDLQNPTSGFESLRAEIDRMNTAFRALQSQFADSIQQSLSDVSASVENQLKEAVTGAEHMARKELIQAIRAVYKGRRYIPSQVGTRIAENLPTVIPKREGSNSF